MQSSLVTQHDSLHSARIHKFQPALNFIPCPVLKTGTLSLRLNIADMDNSLLYNFQTLL